MAGVVDDATDDEDWDERESDDGPMKKGAKDFIRGMMSKSMDDRMDDRVEHLEQRIAAGEELIIALRFCIEEAAARQTSKCSTRWCTTWRPSTLRCGRRSTPRPRRSSRRKR